MQSEWNEALKDDILKWKMRFSLVSFFFFEFNISWDIRARAHISFSYFSYDCSLRKRKERTLILHKQNLIKFRPFDHYFSVKSEIKGRPLYAFFLYIFYVGNRKFVAKKRGLVEMMFRKIRSRVSFFFHSNILQNPYTKEI